MNIKTKYQYSYFIYPFVVEDNKYEKYILKLLKNAKCKIKVFEREKDADLYSYFLPKIRSTLFWTMDMNKEKIEKLNKLDVNMQAKVVASYPCTMFEYDIENDIQGKVSTKDIIYFSISKIEVICFNTGVCFLLIKTILDEGAMFEDLLNFNYKFREVNSSAYDLKKYENIKIQESRLEDIKSIKTIIKEIVGENKTAKDINIEEERFITYSYACVGQEYWQDEKTLKLLEKEFYKFAGVYNEKHKADFENLVTGTMKIYEKTKSEIYGFTRIGTVLLTSDIGTENYTTLPHQFERQFFYTYILELYKKILLNKINSEFSKLDKFTKAQENYIKFAKDLWIEEITNNNTGIMLTKNWRELAKSDEIFIKLKNKYDVIYKNSTLVKSEKQVNWILAILVVMLIVNVIGILIKNKM